MKAIVTGASSGIGRDIARALVCKGWDVILVARRSEKLLELKKELGSKAKCVRCDLSHPEECMKLHEVLRNEDVEMLVNCAGFGTCGRFVDTSLSTEMEMINTNITAVHILTKLFLQDFTEKNRGYILNVASIAGFFSGPLMATYYATKNYVVSLSGAIYEELRRKNSNVKISVLCPGPVDTEFNAVAHVKFSVEPMDSKTVAKQAVEGVLSGKLYIIPSFKMKSLKFVKRLLPDKTVTHYCYTFQKRKK